MKKILLFNSLLFTLLSFSANAQTDTLFLINEKVPCVIKEVTSEEVKFSYLNEEIVNTVYKNTVQKIVFKSGRIQDFSSQLGYKEVHTYSDYEKVTITHIEGDIKGLLRVGEVNSIIEGATILSDRNRLEARALKNIKMKAAMLGANVVYITHKSTQGTKMAGFGYAASGPESTLSGTSYSNKILDANKFKELLNSKSLFKSANRIILWRQGSRAEKFDNRKFIKDLIINNINMDNNIISISGKLKGAPKNVTKFRVVNFTDTHFTIHYEDRSAEYNVDIPF